ncbi:hypothetical protein WDW89_17735 [Deltaproteobacteria bacterium TL4]
MLLSSREDILKKSILGGKVLYKKNCWEFYECGREPGGKNVESLGTCPAATENGADGLNDGQNGGRICWAIAGTLCGGKVQGEFSKKKISCFSCGFFKTVKNETSPFEFQILKPGQEYEG